VDEVEPHLSSQVDYCRPQCICDAYAAGICI